MKKPTLSVLDGHPVPGSLTTQIKGKSVPAKPHKLAVQRWLDVCRPGSQITRMEGSYVFYTRTPGT